MGRGPSRVGAGGRSIGLAVSVAALALCAGQAFGQTMLDEANAPDPYEKTNRVIFFADGALDFLVIRPAAMTYKRVTPRPIRTGLRNAFSNMGEPTVAVNDLLQGHGRDAMGTIARFAENSTVGLAGLFDVASQSGLKHHDNDFGITLARSGFHSGPYIVIPIAGPATVRDGVGEALNILANPFTYIGYAGSTQVGVARTVHDGLDDRASADKDIKRIEATATDIYASIRSYYLQAREAEISTGKVDIQTLPDFDAPDAPPARDPASPSAPTAPTPTVD